MPIAPCASLFHLLFKSLQEFTRIKMKNHSEQEKETIQIILP
jgi:hypothetical protein